MQKARSHPGVPISTSLPSPRPASPGHLLARPCSTMPVASTVRGASKICSRLSWPGSVHAVEMVPRVFRTRVCICATRTESQRDDFCQMRRQKTQAYPQGTSRLSGTADGKISRCDDVERRPDGNTIGLPLLVGVRFQVLFHSPQRGAFHLSLTVLVHYRSSASI